MGYYGLTALGIGFIFLSSTLGAALVYCFKGELSKKANAAFLGLASGVMLAASVWSLLLPALAQAENGWGRYAIIPISIGFLSGAAFLWAFDKITPNTQTAGNFSVRKKAKRLFLAVIIFPKAWRLGLLLARLGVSVHKRRFCPP